MRIPDLVLRNPEHKRFTLLKRLGTSCSIKLNYFLNNSSSNRFARGLRKSIAIIIDNLAYIGKLPKIKRLLLIEQKKEVFLLRHIILKYIALFPCKYTVIIRFIY